MTRWWLGAAAVLAAAVVLPSCFDQPLGPGPLTGRFALSPHFASPHAGIVRINRFRLILRRLSNDSVALDTVVGVARGDTAVDLSFTVAMFSSTERLVLLIRLIAPGGDTAFVAGPDTVTPHTGSGQPPQVAVGLDYVGVGSKAAGVRFVSVAPNLYFGSTIALLAEAFDSANNAIPGTPIAYSSLDTARARIPDRGAGSVVAGTQRGEARIVATLLTGPADTTSVLVQAPPTAVVVVSGDGQKGPGGTPLPQPLVVQVNGADGLGTQGVVVRFRSDQGGGFKPDSAITDTMGRAATVWTLGSVVGADTATIRIDGFPAVQGSASAEVLGPTTLSRFSGDAQKATVGTLLPVPLVVQVTDGAGNPFQGTPVIFAVKADGGILGTPTAASDGAGLAQTTWTLGTVAGEHSVTASAGGLAGSPVPFTAMATPGAAVRLVFGVPPSQASPGVAIQPAVEVRIEDQYGNLVTTATDNVTVRLADNAAGGTLTGKLTVAAVGGIAKFPDLVIDKVGAGYTIEATSGTLTVISPPFDVMAPI